MSGQEREGEQPSEVGWAVRLANEGEGAVWAFFAAGAFAAFAGSLGNKGGQPGAARAARIAAQHADALLREFRFRCNSEPNDPGGRQEGSSP